MARGAFVEWQPRYAEHGIVTFPVVGKKPAVFGYLGLKPGGSRKLVERFPEASAFGLALKPSGITVVDVDTPDERILVDALTRHGDTPFIVRSGSGNFQAWYRRHNEGRRIRPDPGVPIDILGNGFVVAPPSSGEAGRYEMIRGSLDDLDRLPPLQRPASARTPVGVTEGHRNDTLWRYCMKQSRYCDNFEALLDVARTASAGYMPPLDDVEVIRTASSAWGYTERGQNWFDCGRRVISTHDEVDCLLHSTYILSHHCALCRARYALCPAAGLARTAPAASGRDRGDRGGASSDQGHRSGDVQISGGRF